MLRRAWANNLVGEVGEFPASVGRTDWNRDNDARWTVRPDSLNCRFHCRAGRQAVIHQQDDAIAELERRPASPIRAFSTGELALLFTRDVINDGGGNAVPADNVLVENPHATGGNRTHRKLAMARQPELSDQEDIERRVQCASDFVRDRHASARQCQDHDIATALKVSDVCRQFNARLPAVFVRLLMKSCGHEAVLVR